MKSSNLAERLEEFEATLDSLRLTPSPGMRLVVKTVPEISAQPERRVNRVSRARTIVLRDQGLRSFRVF